MQNIFKFIKFSFYFFIFFSLYFLNNIFYLKLLWLTEAVTLFVKHILKQLKLVTWSSEYNLMVNKK